MMYPYSSNSSRMRRAIVLGVLAALGLEVAPHDAAAATTYATTCVDDVNVTGSLRNLVGHATSGDTIDLSRLTCSLITLGSGEIVAGLNDLTIQDSATHPGGRVAISGVNMGRVLRHSGVGTLTLTNVAIISGKEVIPQGAYGGCIYSNGNVSLNNATVHNCVAGATALTAENAKGGGIFARGAVSLINGSSLQGCQAYGGAVAGGGIYAATGFYSSSSSLYSNEAFGVQGAATITGGAVFVKTGPVTVKYSTINHNTAGVLGNGNTGYGGGIQAQNTTKLVIANSTIYGNTANVGAGINTYRAITVTNSTIANNHATDKDGGLRVRSAALTLNSSIVSNNTSGATTVEDDVALRYAATWSSSGTDNLVMTSNVVPPPNVVRFSSDPQLGPLHDNGGPTDTMLPKATSAVLGTGNNVNGLMFEQRDGRFFPRSGAGVTDIGAVQYESIFGDGFE